MSTIAPVRRNIKNVIKNYSVAQIKVREATSNDPWGPTSALMTELADLTYNVVAFSEIMQMLWKRLSDSGKNWRHVYKALVVMEYIIKTGNDKVAQQCRENVFAIQSLKDFQYIEEGTANTNSKDRGVNVREKAKAVVSLLKDSERLKNERTRALKAKERFAQNNITAKKGNWKKNSSLSRSTGELESSRPTTAGEEELQLQIAIAMSKEAAESQTKAEKYDDIRLQIALSESEKQKAKLKESSATEPELLELDFSHSDHSQRQNQEQFGFSDDFSHQTEASSVNNASKNKDFDPFQTSASHSLSQEMWDPFSVNTNGTTFISSPSSSNPDPWNNNAIVRNGQMGDELQSTNLVDDFAHSFDSSLHIKQTQSPTQNNNDEYITLASTSGLDSTQHSKDRLNDFSQNFLGGAAASLVDLDALIQQPSQNTPAFNPFATTPQQQQPPFNPFLANKNAPLSMNEMKNYPFQALQSAHHPNSSFSSRLIARPDSMNTRNPNAIAHSKTAPQTPLSSSPNSAFNLYQHQSYNPFLNEY